MDEITRTNTTRILKFLQPFKLDFNEYSVWNYSRKKFHDKACTRPLLNDAIDFLAEKGYIERVRRPGYYKLSEKGKYFMSWDLENIVETPVEEPEKVQSNWKKWFSPNKSQLEKV